MSCMLSFSLLIFADAFCFMLCHGLFIYYYYYHLFGLFVEFFYFKYDSPSCAVLLICYFFLIQFSHHFLYERAMCSLEK